MTDQDLLERIVASPRVMAGKPVIKGTRLTVEYIQACFLFATRSLEDTAFMPLIAEVA